MASGVDTERDIVLLLTGIPSIDKVIALNQTLEN